MNNLWYHGTTATAARSIVQTGKFRVQDEEGSAFYVSRPGRVYISRDIGVGIQHGQSRVEMGFDDAFGVLQLNLIDPSLVIPDELELGYSVMLVHRDRSLEGQHDDPDDYEYIDDPEYPSAWTEESKYLHDELWRVMPQHLKNEVNELSLDDLLDQEVAANLGDAMIKYFQRNDPEILDRMRREEWFNNYTTPPGNVIIINGWIGVLRDFQKPMKNINFDTEELNPDEVYQNMKIKMKGPIQARGIGKGWYDDRYRHSLAARGVRTR